MGMGMESGGGCDYGAGYQFWQVNRLLSFIEYIYSFALDSTSNNIVVDTTSDVDATTDINVDAVDTTTDTDIVAPADPDDNAGDADAEGDAFACVDEPFLEYNGDEDQEENESLKN
jgi:hypothetical protein